MAPLTLHCVCRQARQLSSRSQRLLPRSQFGPGPGSVERRSISQTSIFRADDADGESPDVADEGSDQDHTPHFDKATFDTLSIQDQNLYLEADAPTRRATDQIQAALLEEVSARDSPFKSVQKILRDAKRDRDMTPSARPSGPRRGPTALGLFARKGSKKAPSHGGALFRQDDISSLGHAQLEHHREIREMYRTAAWEMPLLANLAIPYSEPKRTALPLKFRYTTYLGEYHPAGRKVVVEFHPGHLGLGPKQRAKLIKLLGPRYNPHKNLVRMSCESHETQAQNKRALGATVAELIRTAKGLSQEGDEMWEDVPFDFRHAKSKPKIKFPDAWKIDEKRKKEIEAFRIGNQALLEVPATIAEGEGEMEKVGVPAGGRQYS